LYLRPDLFSKNKLNCVTILFGRDIGVNVCEETCVKKLFKIIREIFLRKFRALPRIETLK
tara:strand:- start:164 stop:343 length:180 start_codon:yes stop_codon:yes gene_type:complete